MLIQQLAHTIASIRYLYFGYYIHSCPNMNYKANFHPAYLLCPEVKTWHDFSACAAKLKEGQFSRMNPDESASDEDAAGFTDKDIGVFVPGKGITNWTVWKATNVHNERDDLMIREIAQLVGKKCLKSLLFYITTDDGLK